MVCSCRMAAGIELEIVAFPSPKHWERWLAKNHAVARGVWLRFFKKDSGVATVKYAEALDGALCYGWIDGQVRKHDAESWVQKFTPRRPRSLWSKRNCDHVARLTAARKMRAAGLKQVEAARADGRWDCAYDSPSKMTVPGDLLKALAKNKKSLAFFKSLNKTNVYSIAWRLQTARKPETRAKRLQAILDMLASSKKFHD
jgi:uncharacterized protein YdeI (YjbR/CyaY-like superfamily)